MKLELLLKGVDQMSGVVKKQSPPIVKLGKDATKTYNSLKKLFSLSGKKLNFGNQFSADLRKSNTDAVKLKKTLEAIGKVKAPKIQTAKIQIAKTQLPIYETSPRTSVGKGQRELDRLYGGRQKPNRYLNGLANLNDRILEPGIQTKNVWRDQYDSLKQYTDAASQLLRLQGRFKQMNLSEGENQKAFSAVEQNTKNVRGINITDSQNLFSNLYQALNNVDDSIAALPTASKYQVAMKALYSDQFSPEQINNQVLQGYKFVELTGATKTREMMESRFNVLSKVISSTGGEVTMAKFLALGKQASPIMQTVTDKGIMNTSAAIDVMGGDRVGTALSALNRAWLGGIMPQHVAQRYQELGLLKEDGIEYNKEGRLKRVKPGGNVLGDVFAKDPLEASKMLADAIRADAAKKGIDVSTPEGMNKQMRGLFGTETQYRLANEFINNLKQVEKESSRAESSAGAIESYDRLNKENNALLKIEEYKAAVDNFRTKAGIPLLQTLGKVAETTAPLLQFFSEHPTVTQFALATMLLSKGISGIAQSASALAGGGGIATFFNSGKNSADNAAKSFRNASGELTGVSNKMSGLKALGKIGLTVVGVEAAVLVIGGFINKYDELIEKSKQFSESTKTVRETYDKMLGLGKQFRAPGDYGKNGEDKPEFSNQANKIYDAMMMGTNLERSLHPERFSTWENMSPTRLGHPRIGADGSTVDFDPAQAAKTWQFNGLSEALKDTNTLALMIEKVQRGEGFTKREGETEAGRMNLKDIGLVLQAFEEIAGKDKMQTARSILEGKTKYQPPPNDPNQGKGFFNSKTGLFDVPYKTTQPAKPAQPFPFLQSFKEGDLSKGVNQTSQAFGQIINPVSGVGKGFFDLSGKGNTLGGSFGGLNTNANSSVNAINSMTGAALNFANTVSTLQIQPPSFGTINLPGFGNVNPPKKFTNPALQQIFGGIPSKASGGTVKRDGLAYIHAGEDIMPADVTSRYRAPKNAGSASGVVVNFNPTINVNSDNPNAAQIRNEMRQEMQFAVRELMKELTPERLAQKTAFAANRASERG